MPIYEYQCRSCTRQFDVLQKVDEDGRNLVCPDCGKKAPEKVLSVFSAAGGGKQNACSAPGGFT